MSIELSGGTSGRPAIVVCNVSSLGRAQHETVAIRQSGIEYILALCLLGVVNGIVRLQGSKVI